MIALPLAVACSHTDRPTAPSGSVGATLLAGSRSIGPLTDSVLGTLRETGNPLIVLVLDRNGVPVGGVPVTWVAFGGGSVAPVAPETNSGGESIAEYTFGAVARSGYGATASVEGLAGSPVVFELGAHAATPTRIEKTRGDALSALAGTKVVYTVTVRDSYGNPTRGVLVAWTIESGGGTVSRERTYTGRDGRAEVTRTLGAQPGDQRTVATATGLRDAPSVTFITRVY